MKYIIILLTLSGCCSLQYPLDGKAQSWCRYSKMADKACDPYGGRDLKSSLTPYSVSCADGTNVEYRK